MAEQEEILSQDELDALLDGVESGDVETEQKAAAKESGYSGAAKLCDLTDKASLIHGRLAPLNVINARYVRQLRMTVFSLLQRKAEIGTKGVEILRFSEYLQRMDTPTSLNVVRLNPLPGIAMVVFDARLVFGLVDLFFGGAGRQISIDGREFTSIENRIIGKLLGRTLEDVRAAWEDTLALNIDHLASEMNPMMAAAHSPDEPWVVSTFQLELDNVSGEIDLAIPYSTLEPVLDTADEGESSTPVEEDHCWAEPLLQHMTSVQVELSCAMAESQLTIGDIKSLKVGDVIPITMNDPATLCANGSAVYSTRIGSSNGKVALRIMGPANN
ncbi:flagellar motor switch protein FliM [bacterium SCSIO 12696]|nr:flagellar motor switch protein FliM [bacterium SCSIO 12696]